MALTNPRRLKLAFVLSWLACSAGWHSTDAAPEESDSMSLLQLSLVLSSGDVHAGSSISSIGHVVRSQEAVHITTKTGTQETLQEIDAADAMPHVKQRVSPYPRSTIQTNRTRNVTVYSDTEVENGTKTTTNYSAPFANVTVNTTVTVVNVTGEGKHSQTQELVSELSEATIAAPEEILLTHIFIFVPVLIAWLMYLTYCKKQWLYMSVLPITLCCCQVTQHMANQSLVVVTNSPYGITACQSLMMTVFAGFWSVSFDQSIIREEGVLQYLPWFVPAMFYGIYQVFTHLVSHSCTLSERTVFNNLCPVVTVIFETVLMPQTAKPPSNTGARISLCTMVLGAVMFSSQSFDFTEGGISMASLMVCSVVACRISERVYVSGGRFQSLMFLVFLDGVVTLIINLGETSLHDMEFVMEFDFWIAQPSIVWLILVSSMTLTGSHLCSLAMLRIGSATTYLVFFSLSGFMEVAFGIAFFGDSVFSSPLSYMGLGISLASGLWYSTDAVFLRDKK